MSTEADQNNQTSSETKHHFKGRSYTIRVTSDKHGWMYTVSGLDITAGVLELNGVEIDVRGTLHVDAIAVTHKPSDSPLGTIEIKTRDEE